MVPIAAAAVLVVEVAGHRWGFGTDVVVELHRMAATLPLPGAPTVIDGVLDARGTVVPVLDLRARLGLARRPARTSDHLVFVDVDGRTMAVRVDRVVDLVTVDDPEPVVLSELASAPRHLGGVSRLADGLLLIQDAAAFLSDAEAAALDDALAGFDGPVGSQQ